MVSFRKKKLTALQTAYLQVADVYGLEFSDLKGSHIRVVRRMKKDGLVKIVNDNVLLTAKGRIARMEGSYKKAKLGKVV